ncbi:hypothetical protein LTR84_000191 [Exophiala bonariae]|uniref:FAD-binding PCMH-type domain-containing protein n=1 Tax=Exophiala bonariae TaxID=1690606 RepID=A0AAV9NTK8_9EURO|nr:hypothetical protein LTR84_000191 [Exophiala bonariae]
MEFYNESALQEKHDDVYESCLFPQKVLPPGTTKTDFAAAIIEFGKVIGLEHVITGGNLINFNDPYPLDQTAHQASAALCPQFTEEIQAIVRIANAYRIPLYGGPAPRETGTVVLSLHRMKSILEVNETLTYVVVEPGVTFFDLDKYFKEHDFNLWIGTPALGWGSIVGNVRIQCSGISHMATSETLDRGHGYTPSGDRQHGIGSMEVVLPSGELLRTGQWGVSRSPSAHACSNNFGPQIDGLFLQSNLGIVTKLAVYVDVAPPAYMSIVVNCPEVEQLSPLIDTLQQLFREEILQNHIHIVNINHFASRDSRKHMQQQREGPLGEDTLDRMRKKYKTGYWRGAFDLYGSEAMIAVRFERIKEVFAKRLSGAWLDHKLFLGKDGKPVDNKEVGTIGAGFPNMMGAALADYNLPADGTGAGAHIDATLILPCIGKVTLDWFVKMRKLMEDLGADPFIGCHVFNRHILFVQEYVFDKTQQSHRERGQKVLASVMAAAKEAGFANYRSHLDHMGAILLLTCFSFMLTAIDAIQDLYDFNGQIYKRLVTDIKVR